MNFPKKLIQVLRCLTLGVFLLLLFTFMFRSLLVAWYLHHRIERFNIANHSILKISSVKIEGLSSILVTGISLKPEHGDTLLKVDSLYASIGILKLISGRIVLHDVKQINTSVLLADRDGVTNYRFLVHGHQVAEDSDRKAVNYASATNRLVGFIFDKIPLSLNIRNFNLLSNTDGHRLGFHIDQVILDDHYFRSKLLVREDSFIARWVIAGNINNHDRKAEFRLYSADTAKVAIPYLSYKWQGSVEFDTLAFSVAGQECSKDLTQVSGFASVRGLNIDHRKIAAGTVKFEKLSVNYLINIGYDYAEIDSASRITYGKIDFHPYLRYRPKPGKQITFQIHKPQFPAQDLFSSFPAGFFTNLEGIRVKGDLSWHLDFFVDLSKPDSLRFETSLDRHQFSVLNYGIADLTKLNGPFLYTAFDHDLPVRTFVVGPENPDFYPLNRISHFLQTSVLTSEDGGFYQHRGFLPDAFRESIITNIKEHRFARGGSTISMQLVKNVFLSRNKTVARKLEEALIVWLIENQGLCSKERMFEVYLNIVEWGPLIYGANEAAHFYFSKDASRLTLAEAIFMASVIPKPKWFRYSFDKNGHLNESNAGFYRLVSGKMVNKGWISPEDTVKLIPDVELKGPARLMLKKCDSIPPDSLEFQAPD